MITVKQAQKDNGAKIQEISTQTKVFNNTEIGCVRELWEEYLNDGLASSYNFLVALENNQVCGFICFGPHALTEGAYDIYWIAVDPSHQNRGVGGALIREVEERVTAGKGSLLILETSSTPDYQPARDFYAKHNFTLEATVRDFYAQEDHLLIYTKHLNQKALLHENHLHQFA